ncbi:GDP-mannose 4,6-dehydratase [bacterium (Candidatus Torokbacteria) CG09_land_8_20_14_0_10_42_11]|nr:MAG: GDP-mannose 4,6-dehydratase [bacterium (Candidatus Torokbacteria) CG09_land_8_20_14_0_10_42_11]
MAQKKKNVLITGSEGFVGSHLADWIIKNKKNYAVHGIKHWQPRYTQILHLNPAATYHNCDIRNLEELFKILQKVKPVKIFHLAAQSFVPLSWLSPAETLETNIVGEANLFEAVRRAGIDPVIQIAGSSEEYGLVGKNESPISEDNPLRPLSPYGVSKVGQDFLGYQYFKSYGLKIVRTRAFNHTGPRRGENFVTSDFAKQIAEIEKGKKEAIIYVGNLEAVRDFTDVRDIVRAYWLATEKCAYGEVYNIGSGKGYKIGEMLKMLLAMSRKKIAVKQDEKRMRPSDVMVLICNANKFRRATGWKPAIPFRKTLRDLLNYWRERV